MTKSSNTYGLKGLAMKKPTKEQLENCALMNWTYIGDGLFTKGDFIGYFTDSGFVKE